MKRWPVFILFFAAACNPAEENRQKVMREYFDIKGLMDKQIELLDSVSPLLYKIALIDGKSDSTQYTPDSTAWRRELQIFEGVDLNKPRLAGLYKILANNTPEIHDTIYVSKIPQSTSIDSLVVSRQTGKSLKIHAFFNAGNFFYSSSRQLELNFTDRHGQLLLEGFGIQGRQKLIFMDTTRYRIGAKVKWP